MLEEYQRIMREVIKRASFFDDKIESIIVCCLGSRDLVFSGGFRALKL